MSISSTSSDAAPSSVTSSERACKPLARKVFRASGLRPVANTVIAAFMQPVGGGLADAARRASNERNRLGFQRIWVSGQRKLARLWK